MYVATTTRTQNSHNHKDVRTLKPHMRSHTNPSQEIEPIYPGFQIEVPRRQKHHIVYI